MRRLRLTALADPQASVAFFDSVLEASRHPVEYWLNCTALAASAADTAQFVAVVPDGTWIGSATVVPHRDLDDAGLIMGVFVAAKYRGLGVLGTLLDAASEWASGAGLSHLMLEVHVDNARAQAAYARCGFVKTKVVYTPGFGFEYEMCHEL